MRVETGGQPTLVVVLSGQIASGKSTLAQAFVDRGFVPFRTGCYIADELAIVHQKPNATRAEKQEYGDQLDRATAFGWVCAAIGGIGHNVVIDSVRRIEQVERLRECGRYRVVHIHLEANPTDLARRWHSRTDECESYAQIKAHATESQVDSIRANADLVINTSRCTPEDVRLRAFAMVDVPNHDRLVDVLVGGQYGSEGKGHVASHIAREYDLLVRVGGPNAGHTVLSPINNQKTSFYHIPSGALHAPDADLVLGPAAVINVEVLEKEAMHLGGLDSLRGRLWIDPQANIITREDIDRETDLVGRVGSTGQGVGMATARKIAYRGDPERQSLARDCPALAPFIRPTLDVLENAYRRRLRILLEGTQGTGLSLYHGVYPYVTSRDTTVSGTAGEAGIPASRIRRSIVVLRTNPIRVQSPPGGTSGPMGIETTWETISRRAGIPADELRQKEMTTTTKRQRRVAEFNWADLRRAVLLNGPSDIALTFVDYIAHENRSARRFEQLTPGTQAFIFEIERVSGVPVSLISTRFHQRSIIDRRNW